MANVKKVDTNKAVELYVNNLLSCGMIAEIMKVSRQAIFKALRHAKVDTSKRKFTTKCSQCGKEISRTRQRIRDTMYPFCSNQCYFAYIKNPNYQDSRQGTRIANHMLQEAVSYQYSLVSHHVDGNDSNNSPQNIWGFRSHAHHMRYHRGGLAQAFILSTGEWKSVQRTTKIK